MTIKIVIAICLSIAFVSSSWALAWLLKGETLIMALLILGSLLLCSIAGLISVCNRSMALNEYLLRHPDFERLPMESDETLIESFLSKQLIDDDNPIDRR